MGLQDHLTACDCPHDVRVFGHVHPCPQATRHAPAPDRAAQLLAQIKAMPAHVQDALLPKPKGTS